MLGGKLVFRLPKVDARPYAVKLRPHAGVWSVELTCPTEPISFVTQCVLWNVLWRLSCKDFLAPLSSAARLQHNEDKGEDHGQDLDTSNC